MDFELTREQRDIKRAAHDFANGELTADRAHAHELAHTFPEPLYKAAASLGFVGLDYPETVGGGGLGVMENVLSIEQMCKADSGLGMAIHLAWLPAKIIKICGTDAQREHFLRPITQGRGVSAISLTEPDHGSDLTRVNTTARFEGDRIVLNGTKIFTTNASYATHFIVLAQDDAAAGPGRGMSTVLVEADPATWLSGELSVTELTGKMGLRMTSSGEVVYRELAVPRENLLGERGMGLKNVLSFLDHSRIEIASQALGNAEGAFLRALQHARTRTQFGQPLIEFQAIGHLLARMFSQLQGLRWMVYHAASVADRTRPDRNLGLLTSMVKHHVPQAAKAIIDDAMTVFGGYGYFLEQDVERRYRDNRIIECYEGTVEVQLNNMVRLLSRANLGGLEDALL